MKIHHEGVIPILIVSILLIIAVLSVLFFIPLLLIKGLVVVPVLIISLLILWFFRIPNREILKDNNLVISPADGKIVVIEKVKEEEYFMDERIQVSIFMSPLNVHQNVYPIDGEVVYKKYHKGDYLVAWHPKSSTQNERSTLVIKHEKGTEILVRQIAGAVARRICTYAEAGDNALQGAEFGFIKFGSRVDVFLPLDAKIVCNINDKSVNKRTVLAELN